MSDERALRRFRALWHDEAVAIGIAEARWSDAMAYLVDFRDENSPQVMAKE